MRRSSIFFKIFLKFLWIFCNLCDRYGILMDREEQEIIICDPVYWAVGIKEVDVLMKKKTFVTTLCVMLSVLLLFGCAAAPASSVGSTDEIPPEGNALSVSQEQGPFTDVSPSDWFHNHVMWAVDAGYFSGTTNTTFEPDSPMSRAMLVTVLANRERITPDRYRDCRFVDVESGSWYAEPVEWAAAWGIVSGTGMGEFTYNTPTLENFSPAAPLTRQDGAVILYNYLEKLGMDTAIQEGMADRFSDAGEISSYARTALDWAVGAGVLKGDGGKLRPQGTLTRAEAAAVLHSFLDLLPEGAVLGDFPVKPIQDTLFEANGQIYTYHIPQIQLDSVDMQQIHNSINETYFETLSWVQQNVGSGYSPNCIQLGYFTGMSHGVLSLVTFDRTYEDIDYQIWNVDTTTGRQIDSTSLLERSGYTMEEYQQAARTALEKAFNGYAAYYQENYGSDSYTDNLREMTLYPASYGFEDWQTPIDELFFSSPCSMKGAQLFVDSSGQLWMVGVIWHDVGSQRRYVALPLELYWK